jgi:hypothetical protein
MSFKRRLTSMFILAIAMSALVWRVTAQETPLLYGKTVRGELAEGAQQTWSFEADREALIQIQATSQTRNSPLTISLRDRRNNLLAELSDDSPLLTFRIPQTGSYTLTLRAEGGGSLQYEVELALLAEGLRSFEQGQLDYGRPVENRLSDSTPYHLWSFNGQAGQVIDITFQRQSGDLLPVFSLTAPSGDILQTVSAPPDKDTALLSAYRLPVSGLYQLTVRRDGPNLGLNGTTSGEYRLELTLRNSLNVPAPRLALGATVEGVFNAESRLARYNLPESGVLGIEVQLSSPACMADLTLMDNGLVVLMRTQAPAPLGVAWFVPRNANPILELQALACPLAPEVRYRLRVLAVPLELPSRPLARTVSSAGAQEAEYWHWYGQKGDIVAFALNWQAPQTEAPVRVLDAGGRPLYDQVVYADQTWILSLPESNFYQVELRPRQIPYQLHFQTLGINGLPFDLRDPSYQQTFNVNRKGYQRLDLRAQAASLVWLTAPDGEATILGQTDRFGNLSLAPLLFDSIGRYTLSVAGDSAPQVALNPVPDYRPLTVGAVGKGFVAQAKQAEIWELPVRRGEKARLHLEVLTPLRQTLSAFILDGNGEVLGQATLAPDRSSLIFDSPPAASEAVWQVWLSGWEQGARYRLTREANSILPSAPPFPQVNQAGTSVPNHPSQAPRVLLPLRLAVTPDSALFAEAPNLNLPNTINFELGADQTQVFWALNITRGQYLLAYSLNLSGGAAGGLTLFNSEGRVVAQNWESTQNSHELRYRIPKAGIYYLALNTLTPGQRYSLSIEFPQNLGEAIQTILRGRTLALGETTFGEFITPNQKQGFYFWGIDGARLQLALSLLSGNLAPSVRIEQVGGATLLETKLSESSILSQDLPPLPSTGLYYVEVQARLPLDAEAVYSRYALALVESRVVLPHQSQLRDLAYGEITLRETLDTWLIEGRPDERLTLRLTPIGGTRLDPLTLALADSTGREFVRSSLRFTETSLVLRELVLPRAGVYRVHVAGGSNVKGAYRLELERQTIAPFLIGYGETRQAAISPDTLVQRWQFVGNAGDTLSTQLAWAWGDIAQLAFQLLGPNGELVWTAAAQPESTSLYQGGLRLTTTGLYTLVVSSLNPTPPTSTYSLTLTLDSQAQARSSGSYLAYGETWGGVLYADDAKDVWAFAGEAGESISVQVTGRDPTFIPALSLLGEGGLIATRTGITESRAELVNFILPASGVFAIEVTGINSYGAYDLRLDRLDSPQTPRFALNADVTTSATLAQADQRHLWNFNGTAGDSVTFSLRLPRRATFIPRLRLIGPDGTLLWTDSAFSTASQTFPTYELPQDGVYTLEVSAFATLSRQLLGDYELRLSRQAASPPNTPRPLAYNQEGIGNFNANNRDDEWLFQGETGDVVSIRLQKTSGNLDPALDLYGPFGVLVAQADDTPSTLDAEITLTLNETGIYRLRPHALANTEGNYLLSLDLLYRPTQEAPPSDRILAYGQSLLATLDPLMPGTPSESLWYFNGAAGDNINLDLSFPSDRQPLRLFLADGQGKRYLQGERLGNRVQVRAFRLPADGLYQIILQRPLDTNNRGLYPYILNLELAASGESSSLAESPFLQLQRTYESSFDGQAPYQVWYYLGQAGQSLNLQLERLAGSSPLMLSVFDPAQRLLLIQNAAFNPETRQSYPLVLPSAGLYRVVVAATYSDPFLRYRLALYGQALPFLAGELAFNQAVSANLAPASGAARWLLPPLEEQALVRLLSSDGPLRLSLEDEAGRIVGQSGEGEDRLFIPPSTSESPRYVVVRGEPFAQTGLYTLGLSAIDLPPSLLNAIPLQEADVMEGELRSANNEKIYRFEGAAGQAVSFKIQGLSVGNLRLSVLGPTGLTLATAADELPHLILPHTGLYGLQITGDRALAYRLSFNRRLVGENPRPSSRNFNLLGQLSAQQTSETWTIPAKQGERLRLSVQDFRDSLQMEALLFSPEGQVLAFFTELGDSGEAKLEPFFIPQTGVYLLRVGALYRDLPPTVSQYVLRLEEADEALGLGSIGGVAFPTPQAWRGGLNRQDPQDTWLFMAELGRQYDLSLTQESGQGEIRVRLLNPEGRAFLENTSQAGRLVLPTFVADQNGTYTLEVMKQGRDLQIYAFTLNQRPNDFSPSLENAQALKLGQSRAAQLHQANRRQAWVFFALSGQALQVQLNVEESAASHLLVTLLDPTGAVLQAGIGGLQQDFLVQAQGFYALITENIRPDRALNYQLQIRETDTLVGTPRVLQAGQAEQAVFNLGERLHEWQLDLRSAGDYRLQLLADSTSWTPRGRLVDATGQIIALLDASLSESPIFYLTPSSRYRLLVEGDGFGGAYRLLLDFAASTQTAPLPLRLGQIESGRLTSSNLVDEWAFTASASQIYSISLRRLEGEGNLTLRLYAPENLFLNEFVVETTLALNNVLLPIDGNYLLQVLPQDPTQPVLYELRVNGLTP